MSERMNERHAARAVGGVGADELPSSSPPLFPLVSLSTPPALILGYNSGKELIIFTKV